MLPLLLSLLAPPAQAQGVNAHGLHVAPDAGDPRAATTVRIPLSINAGDYGLQLLGEHAYGLVVNARQPAVNASVERTPILKSLWAANIAAHVAVHSNAYLDLHVPMYIAAQGPDGAKEVGVLGDIRLAGNVLAMRAPTAGGWSVAAHTWLDIPTGDAPSFLGIDGVGGGLGTTASWSNPSLLIAAEAGLGFRPAVEQRNVTGSDVLVLGTSVGGILSDKTSLVGELRAELPWRASSVPGTGRTLEGIASVRMRTHPRSSVRFGVGYGMSRGVGVPSWRVFTGGSFGKYSTPFSEAFSANSAPSLVCQDGSAPVVGRSLEDGCYVPLTIVARYGKKTLAADIRVQTPNGETTASVSADGWRSKALPGDVWVVEAQANGCLIGVGQATVAATGSWIDVPLTPVRDGQVKVMVEDADGVPVGGAKPIWSGAHPDCFSSDPVSNVDGSLAVSLPNGTWSLQVMHPNHGPARTTVEVVADAPQVVRMVLPAQRITLRDTQIVLKEPPLFDGRTASLLPESEPTLDELAAFLKQNPQLLIVAIAGHTDNQGDDMENLKLSMDRAKHIVSKLIERGLDPSRLEVQGFGATEPIATNRTAVGRQENMRIEIRVLETGEDKP